MDRKLLHVNKQRELLLTRLADPQTGSMQYRETMTELGTALAQELLKKLPREAMITLACTAEDADFLARGIMQKLEAEKYRVKLAVFWNQRFKPNRENGISVAPIIKEFHEKGYEQANIFVVVKSIISSSCVVRTNIARLFELSNPNQIFIVAPVLYKDAIPNLNKEFASSISKKFKYLYFAEDSQRNEEGLIEPGIGGDVYKRLGFGSQTQKNRYVPDIVKARRHTLGAV